MVKSRSRNYLVDILVILALVTLGYAGYKFAPVYIDHYRLKNEVREVVVKTNRVTKAGELKARIREVAEKYQLLLENDDVLVEFPEQAVKIRFGYERNIPVPFSRKEITIHFVVEDGKDLTLL
ncbi:MAG: hypothetical protein FJ125_09830 [Deltaproteobacteria bacterium]|nr:hypothetical protein [Deltaproteobacteria bacterium]